MNGTSHFHHNPYSHLLKKMIYSADWGLQILTGSSNFLVNDSMTHPNDNPNQLTGAPLPDPFSHQQDNVMYTKAGAELVDCNCFPEGIRKLFPGSITQLFWARCIAKQLFFVEKHHRLFRFDSTDVCSRNKLRCNFRALAEFWNFQVCRWCGGQILSS